jgi:hypothetical protein
VKNPFDDSSILAGVLNFCALPIVLVGIVWVAIEKGIGFPERETLILLGAIAVMARIASLL